MAGGPIYPRSVVVLTADNIYPLYYQGQGAVPTDEELLGVEASLSADSTFALVFAMPESLPTGTGKLRLRARANATSGNAKVNPKWKSVAAGEDPSTGALNAETVQTLTWASGDADDYKELLVTLDADTLVAGEELHMSLVFETASWTLAAESGWSAAIVWQ